MAEKHKRRSVDLIKQIDKQIDVGKLNNDEKTQHEWKTAVTEELKTLTENMDDIENRINVLETKETEEPLLNTSKFNKSDMNIVDQVEALTDLIETIKSERLKDKAFYEHHLNLLDNRVTLLETENDTLIEKNSKLHKEIDDLSELINGEEGIAKINETINIKCKQITEEYTQDITQLKVQIESLSTQTLNVNKQTNAYTKDTIHKIKLNIPAFKGTEMERPIKFLGELKTYIAATKPDENELKCILTQALQDSAKNWYFINDSDIHNYENFEALFKERYWNTNIQRNINRKVEYGQYYENSKMSRVDYATHIYGFAKELDNNSTEAELSTKICQHFQRNIRYAFNGQPTKDKNALFKILMDFDNDDKREKQNTKQKTYYNDNANHEQNKPANTETNTKNNPYTNITQQRKPYTENRNININTQHKPYQQKTISLINTSKPQTRHTLPNTQNKPNWTQRNFSAKFNKQAMQEYEKIDPLDSKTDNEKYKNQASGSGNGK